MNSASLIEQLHALAVDRNLAVDEFLAQLLAREEDERLFEDAPGMLVIMREDGSLCRMNRAFRVFFGVDYAPVHTILQLVHPDDMGAMMGSMESALGAPIETRVLTRDGELCRMAWTLTPHALGCYAAAHVIGIDAPTTPPQPERFEEVVRLNDILEEALQTEIELHEMQKRFIAMVSHEFRTPLTVILSSSEILRTYGERLTPEKKSQHLSRIRAHVRHLEALVHSILSLNRGNMQTDFTPAPIHIESFCREVIEEMRLIVDVSHDIVFEAYGASGMVMLDRELIRQMLTNLISNAVKYSPHSQTVWVTLKATVTTLEFIVRDTGIGIPEDEQPHVFEMFFRARNVGAISGTGLGLAIVNHAVKVHYGVIKVESKLDEGTTFTVRLPAMMNRV